MGRTNLTVPLQRRDGVDERRIPPRFERSSRVRGGDDVGRRLFDDAEPVELQLADDRGLTCTGRAGDDEPSHLFAFRERVRWRPSSFCNESRRRNPSSPANGATKGGPAEIDLRFGETLTTSAVSRDTRSVQAAEAGSQKQRVGGGGRAASVQTLSALRCPRLNARNPSLHQRRWGPPNISSVTPGP